MKHRRIKIREHKFLIRTKWSEGHHLTAQSRGGESVESNLLLLELYRHTALHYLFENRTLSEIIAFLKSMDDISWLYRKEYSVNAIHLLFGDMSLADIIICLMRIRAIKHFHTIKLRLQ